MQVDYISDLHIDNWHPFQPITKEIVLDILQFHRMPEKKELLIIAGDIGHSNEQNKEFLFFLQKHLYEHVIFVLGNHDYYLVTDFDGKIYSTSLERISDMKTWAKAQENIHCLDGSIVEINSVKFGGCDSWYDGKYFTHIPKESPNESIFSIWRKRINDSHYIKGYENGFIELFEIEQKKIQAVYRECDVMITHVMPSINKEHITLRNPNDAINSFYCFDGEEFIKNGSMQHWVFGHIHEIKTFEHNGVQMHCNAIGYSEQIGRRGIASFNVGVLQ